MMIVTDEIRSLILENTSAQELRKVATRQGMKSLRDDGFRQLHSGRTTVQEILRVTKDETFDLDGLLGLEQAGTERWNGNFGCDSPGIDQ
jgi:hypothetical protein